MAVGIHQNNAIYGNPKDNGVLQDTRTTGNVVSDGQAAGVQAATKADAGLLLAVEGGAEVAHTTSTLVEKNMQQYMEMLERNQGKASEETESDSEIRERRRALYRSLSAEELAQLRQMQIDLSNVSLEDVQGLVNTMRAKTHQEAFSQMMADVCDGMDAEQDAMEAALPADMANVAVSHVLDEAYCVREEQTVYLLQHELPLTISNLYKSEYAAGTAKIADAADTEEMGQDTEDWIAPRLEQVLLQAGIMAEDGQIKVPYADMMDAAKYFVQNDIPLTAASIRDYLAIADINAQGIDRSTVFRNMLMQKALGQQAEDANVYYDQQQRAEELTARIRLAADTDIQRLQQADAMWPKDQLTARRQLEELRLAMTQTAANRLVMTDIHIDTRPLSAVVKQLRQMEQQMAQEALQAYEAPVTTDTVAMYQDTMQKVDCLGRMPAALLGTAVQTNAYTIQTLYDAGIETLESTQAGVRGQYAVREYEALMTAPRTDMGDSIHTAFAHMDSLLQEMGEEVTPANQRAVRILGYNQMEITPESLDTIRQADAKVTELLDRMTPQAVIDMIRQGRNPVYMPIDELIQTLEEMRGDAYMQEDDRYSSFLYKLEQKGALTQEERESYIGIFRLLDKVQKQSGRDIGSVIRNGQALTLEHLLEAHRSNQAKGMDVTVSDAYGMLTGMEHRGISISEQIEAAFGTDAASVVEQAVAMMQEPDSQDYLQEQYAQNVRAVQEDAVWEMFEAQEITPTAAGMDAVLAMQTDESGIYGMTVRYMTSLRERAGIEEPQEDDLTQCMMDVESHFDDEETVNACYDAISERLNVLSKEELTGVLTYRDIQALKQIHTGFHILKQQAKQEDYQVPLQINGKLAMMHVSFVQQGEGDDRNQILISMQQETYGQIRAELITGEQAELSAGIVTDNGIWKWEDALIAQAKQTDTKVARYQLAKQVFAAMTVLLESAEKA